jgi:hypothetical protein
MMVGERSSCLRSSTVRSCGGSTSAYADMSNNNTSENLVRRKPKDSCARIFRAGLVGA